MMNGQHDSIDEGLYSRQLYVMGKEGMLKMAQSNVLISGMGGLGVEVAKDVCLAGLKSVTLHDPKTVQFSDLSSQFFCHESDIGYNRASVTKDKIAELNNHVLVKVLPPNRLVPGDHLKEYQVIVLTDSSLDEQLKIGDYCHAHNIKFIVANTQGLFGQLFCDFGETFEIHDATGEEPLSVFIQNIGIDDKGEGIVLCLEESRHGFEDGDYVTFTELRGMTELNQCKPRKIKVVGPDVFTIGDIQGLSPYVSGGLCVQVKMPKTIHFKSIAAALDDPQFILSDFAKFDRPQQLHVLFQAMFEFRKCHDGNNPRPWNKDDAAEFVQLAQTCANKKGSVPMVTGEAPRDNGAIEIDDKLARAFAYICHGAVVPMQAVIGAIAAQEVMKACSHKFNPVQQWFYFDALECLPKPLQTIDEIAVDVAASLNATNCLCRYKGQINVFGMDFQRKLSTCKFFMVGCGAIGCELLKNLALMGVGCSKDTSCPGGIVVTDMDSIERSNLNRQFLFRTSDIQKMKSTAAAVAVKTMNDQVRIEAHELRVGGAEANEIYNEQFYKNVDCVLNALDNVQARLFMDGQCVLFGKPLLESGTLGTKGNTQVVIPHLTESYGSSRDPPEKSIPMCTLHNFPYQVEHTIQWARDLFEGIFAQASESAVAYLQEPSTYLKRLASMAGGQPIEELETLKQNIKTDIPRKFDDCIRWGRLLFQEKFTNSITQMLYNFPPDHKTTQGTPFWSGTKRCPVPIQFDSSQLSHLAFIQAAANVRAHMYSLPYNNDLSFIRKIADSIQVPAFEPRSGVKIAANDSEMEMMGPQADEERISDLKRVLSESQLAGGPKIQLEEFEKDDDSNFHIDFVTATSNLRAQNYNIPPADRLKTKLIAGKIIPAIATTTSLVAGLVCLEAYKLAQGHKDIEMYKNGFVNLALPFFVMSEPIAPEVKEYGPDKKFTMWDKLEVNGDITLQEFIDHFKNEHKLNSSMISYGNALIYAFFMDPKKKKERLGMKLTKLVELVTKEDLPKHLKSLILEMCAEDDNDEEVDIPTIKVNI